MVGSPSGQTRMHAIRSLLLYLKNHTKCFILLRFSERLSGNSPVTDCRGVQKTWKRTYHASRPYEPNCEKRIRLGHSRMKWMYNGEIPAMKFTYNAKVFRHDYV